MNLETKIKLCRVARRVRNSDDEIGAHNETLYIYFENYFWCLFPYIPGQREEILGMLNDIKDTKSLFSLNTEFDNGDYYLCIEAYAGWRLKYSRQSVEFAENIFPYIFRNYKDTFRQFNVEDATEDGRLHKRYITTKLYDMLYEKHKTIQNDLANIKFMTPSCLKSTLYNFQQRTVSWLLMREQQDGILPSLYVKLEPFDSGPTVYKHFCCNVLFQEEPKAFKLAPGGILAEEMGLGKTVEMITLILLHQRAEVNCINYSFDSIIDEMPKKRRRIDNIVYCLCGSQTAKTNDAKKHLIQCENCKFWQHKECVCKYRITLERENSTITDPYYCPECWTALTKVTLVETAATIIVSPQIIKLQWYEEIKKHTNPPLRVLLYNGISTESWIAPNDLAKYQIVLTDYNVLRNEIYHSRDFISERSMRNRPKSMRVTTPLLMMNWWRVCLDEAQMVEKNSSNLAKMVRMLPAINRWAVTGTPIQRSIDDLLPLLQFMGVDEFNHSDIWNKLVNDFVISHTVANKRLLLIDILQKCMWRTSKANVVEDIQLPPQNDIVHRIELSNLECLFYIEQHAKCEVDFLEKLEKYTSLTAERRTISPQIMKFILQPLLKIRQCCNMPVVEDKQNNANKQFLHPNDLHQHLISKNENDCKTQLRMIASAFNGLAGLFCLRKDFENVIKFYELVLKLAEDYKEKNICVDSLLQIHALHNLILIFHENPNLAAERNCDVSLYKQRLHDLEWKYLKNCADTLKITQAAAQDANAIYKSSFAALKCPPIEFLSEIVEIVVKDYDGMHQPLMEKLNNECYNGFSRNDNITTMNGMLYVLNIWFEKVLKAYSELDVLFTQLNYFYDNIRLRTEADDTMNESIKAFTNRVYDCHLSKVREDFGSKKKSPEIELEKSEGTCELCVIDRKLKELEMILFEQTIDKMPSFEHSAVNIIYNFMRIKLKDSDLVEELANQKHFLLQMINLWKKFLTFWIEIEYTVKSFDELDMCKMRISITTDANEKNNFRIMEEEIDVCFEEQRANLRTAEHEFASKLARLRYIKHLEKDIQDEPCPICHVSNALRYTVLECGHHMCLVCMKSVNQYFRSSFSKITCPICRQQHNSQTVYYVTRLAKKNGLDVDGVYSSKITYIVRLIKQLMQNEAEDTTDTPLKILIFSQWQAILNAISVALTENKIKNISQCTPEAVSNFKNPRLGITCLLLPLTKGSKGLNLIEAGHVFLVEPILNPGEELQAIGRVHRVGQIKPTTVHRFIVNNTIEDNIFKLVSTGTAAHENWDFDNVSLQALRDLFILQNPVVEELSMNEQESASK